MSICGFVTITGLIIFVLTNSGRIVDTVQQEDRAIPLASTKQHGNIQKESREKPRDEQEQATSRVLEILPTRNVSTIVGAMHTVARAVGRSESQAMLQGVLGHAFSFEMKYGAGDVWQEENLDYIGLFRQMVPKLGYRFQGFEAKQRDNKGDFQKLKADAWNAVRASIDRGVPAIAWQPMSREQKAAGIRAGAWGLLVGYNNSDETYTVRHQYHKKGREAYTVRYDAFGHTDPIEWFHVLVYDSSISVDPLDTHITALRNAVAFANGTRWDSEKSKHKADALGFAAYELWGSAIESGVAEPKHSHNHARELVNWRQHAATYLRELATIFPKAGSQLKIGADHYEHLIETAKTFQGLCEPIIKEKVFPIEIGSKVADLVTTMMDAEHKAIQAITDALVLLDRSHLKKDIVK